MLGYAISLTETKLKGLPAGRRIRWMGLTQRRTRDSFRSLYVRINSKAYACMHASLDSASLAPHACVIDVACGLHVCWPAYSPVRLLHRAEQRIKQAFTTGTWHTQSALGWQHHQSYRDLDKYNCFQESSSMREALSVFTTVSDSSIWQEEKLAR